MCIMLSQKMTHRQKEAIDFSKLRKPENVLELI